MWPQTISNSADRREGNIYPNKKKEIWLNWIHTKTKLESVVEPYIGIHKGREGQASQRNVSKKYAERGWHVISDYWLHDQREKRMESICCFPMSQIFHFYHFQANNRQLCIFNACTLTFKVKNLVTKVDDGTASFG